MKRAVHKTILGNHSVAKNKLIISKPGEVLRKLEEVRRDLVFLLRCSLATSQ